MWICGGQCLVSLSCCLAFVHGYAWLTASRIQAQRSTWKRLPASPYKLLIEENEELFIRHDYRSNWGKRSVDRFFYKMRIFIPIFFIDSVFLSVQIELIHPESDLYVLGLPQFLIAVPVFHYHSYGLHHFSAPLWRTAISVFLFLYTSYVVL